MEKDNMAPDLTGVSPVGSASPHSSYSPDLSDVTPIGTTPGVASGAPDLSEVPVVGVGKTPPQEDGGMLSKAWDWATKSLLGRDSIVDLMGKEANFYSLGQLSRFKKDKESWSQFVERMRTTPVVDPLEEKFPLLAGVRTAAAEMVQSTATQDQSFASPVGIAMLGAGIVGKIPGALGTLAKVGTGLATAEFGREGIVGAAHGIEKLANAEYGGPSGWISESGAQGLGETLSGLGGAAFAAHGMAEQLSAPAKRYVNAVRETAAKVTGGLEARGRGVLSERALEIQDAAAAKTNVAQALETTKRLGVIDQATHDTIADLAKTSPDKAARVLQDKLSGDALGRATPKADLTNTATEDGRLAIIALANLDPAMRNVPEIKAMLEESTDTMAEHLAKNLNGDILDKLNSSGNGDTAELLSKVAENNVHRQAQKALDTGDNVGWLNKLKSGYDKLNTGIRDSNPDIEKNAQTVNELIRLRNTMDSFQKQFPKTDYVKFALDALTAKSWKSAGAMLLAGIFGHSAFGIGGAGIMGIKWAATRTPVIRAMTNAMGNLHEALTPKADVQTTVGMENGTVEPPQVKPPEPQAIPHQEAEATGKEPPTVQPVPTEPQIMKPGQGLEIAGQPTGAVAPTAPGPGETPAVVAAGKVQNLEPAIAEKAAAANAELHGKNVIPDELQQRVEASKRVAPEITREQKPPAQPPTPASTGVKPEQFNEEHATVAQVAGVKYNGTLEGYAYFSIPEGEGKSGGSTFIVPDDRVTVDEVSAIKAARNGQVKQPELAGTVPEKGSIVPKIETAVKPAAKGKVPEVRIADPRATGTPEEKADFVKEFRDKHPEAAQHGMTDQEILDTESRGKYVSRSVKGETEEAAKAEAEKRGGKWEAFQRKYNISPQLKAGTWGIRAKTPESMTPEAAVAQHIAEHPEDAGRTPKQNLASFITNHPEINNLDANMETNPLPGSRAFQTRVGIHEAIHGMMAHLLGLRVMSIGAGLTPGANASMMLDYDAVPRTPRGTSNHLTALASAQADPYLTTLSGGVAGELHAGYDTTLSRNANPTIMGTDAWKFRETAKTLGITDAAELKELWNFHVNKAKALLQKHAQALPRIVKSLNDRMDRIEGQGYELEGNTYRKYINAARTLSQSQEPVSWSGKEFHDLMTEITGKEAPSGAKQQDRIQSVVAEKLGQELPKDVADRIEARKAADKAKKKSK